MGAEIDRLDIQIESQAGKAIQQMDKLAKKMEAVSKALGGINMGGLVGLSDGVRTLEGAMQSFDSSVNADSFTKIANGLKKFTKISSGSLWNTSYAVGGLAKNLNGLNGVSFRTDGLNDVANAISKFGRKTSTQATQNLPKIREDIVNFITGLNGIGAVTFETEGLTKLIASISRLGNKSTTNATTNIPKLSSALRNMMGTLASAPAVSQNVIQMTNAMAALASQGSRAGSTMTSLKGVLGGYSTSARTAARSTARVSKSMKSFSQIASKFYANAFMVIRAIKAMWQGVEKSMDYVETFNYWNVTLDKIGKEFGSQFEKFGAESAESYTRSFRDRLGELTRKMSGYQIGEAGDLTMTKTSGLGLDPEQLMEFQAKIGSVTNSVGLIGETSINTAKALSMLSADMSSFTNTELSTVMSNFQSGLIGQSRALYKYGIDITNATLQTYAYKTGLTTAISEMSQADKMQLRLLAILDQSKVVWGDQANTLNSVANQYRIMRQQMSNLARTIGNLFLPIVKTVLPYVNGLVMATNKLFTALGFKMWGGNWLKDLQDGVSDGYDNTGLEDIETGADDASDSLKDATGSAKKLKGALRAFDELKVINLNTDSGSGSDSKKGTGGGVDLSKEIGDALKEYESVWDKALADSQNKAQEVADAICNTFKNGDYKSVGEYIGKEITEALNKIKWNDVYNAASGFGADFASFLNELISPELFGAVGTAIASSLNTAIYTALSFGKTFDWTNFGESIAQGINDFFTTFDFEALADTLNTWVDGLEEMIGAAIEDMDYASILSGLYDFFSNLEFDTVAVIIGTLAVKQIGGVKIWNAVKSYLGGKLAEALAGLGFGTMSLSELTVTIASILPKFQGTAGFDVVADWVMTGIEEAMDNLLPDWINDFIGKFVLGFSTAGVLSGGNPIAAAIGALFTTFPIEIKWFGEGGVFSFEWTSEWFEKAKEAFGTAFDEKRDGLLDIGGWIVEGILDGFVGALAFIFEPITRFFNAIVDGICKLFGIHSPAKKMKPLGGYILQGIVGGFVDKVSEFNTAISKWFEESVKPWFTLKRWNQLGENVKKSLKEKWGNFVSWWSNTGIVAWWNNHVAPWFTAKKWSSIADGIRGGIKAAWNNFEEWWSNTGIVAWWNNHVAPWFTAKKWSDTAVGIKNGIKSAWDSFKKWWSDTAFAKWWDDVTSKFSADSWNFGGIKNGLSSAWGSAMDALKSKWNSFANWLNDKLTIKIDTSTVIGRGIKTVIGTDKIALGNIPTFAYGGFPNTGELFMARENGITEMVGSIGSRPAVANNDQITASIAAAVYQGNQEGNVLLRQEIQMLKRQNEILLGILEKENGISANDLFNSVRQSARQHSQRTGKPAFDF